MNFTIYINHLKRLFGKQMVRCRVNGANALIPMRHGKSTILESCYPKTKDWELLSPTNYSRTPIIGTLPSKKLYYIVLVHWCKRQTSFRSYELFPSVASMVIALSPFVIPMYYLSCFRHSIAIVFIGILNDKYSLQKLKIRHSPWLPCGQRTLMCHGLLYFML